MLKSKIFRNKTVAISWLVIMSILFCLPGSAFPKENWMKGIYIDKWVHIGLFSVLVFLWRSSFDWGVSRYNLLLLFFASLYGLGIEIIQLYWVANRSFDLYDILSDITGAVLGLLIWLGVYKKNKPL